MAFAPALMNILGRIIPVPEGMSIWQDWHASPLSNSIPDPSGQVTRLLQQWQDGDRAALDRLIPLVYDELRVIASRYLEHEGRKDVLQTTALVNEAYLKLVDQRDVDWQNRAHFFGIAARLMRRILVDN